MSRFKIDLPYISPWKFLSICTVLFLVYQIILVSYAYFHTEPYSYIDYIGNSQEAKDDVSNEMQTISKMLHAKDYGQE